MQLIRSILFTTYIFVSAPLWAIVIVVSSLWAGYEKRYAMVCAWVDSVLWMCKTLCRLDYEVVGQDNIPVKNTVAMLKHSSAWEAIAQFKIFPPQSWVLKRELMWIPFVGWALAGLKPIAIDRKAGRSAVDQVLSQGRERLADGLWVMVFPEGTRMPVGTTRRYGISGALLAQSNELKIIPVAHNAGDYWPRRGWLKRPGIIKVVIGPPIDTAGKTARQASEDVQHWIESTMADISGNYQ
jgi:1-acyl-sn-glycerol-3-phosphate acyltransferase